MPRQAIITAYYGPTNHRSARIKATCNAGTLWRAYEWTDVDKEHALAAQALAEKLGWGGHWVEGGMPKGNGNVYVSTAVSSTGLPSEVAFTTDWRE